MSTYYYNSSSHELYRYGVPGMKWGRRKARPLSDRQIKRYAKKGYSNDALKSNKTKAGKAYDKITGAHKIAGDMKYSLSSKAQNKARAEKYLKQLQEKKQDKAVEKYAKKGYAQLQYQRNKSSAGKAYDKLTGAHKIGGEIEYGMSTKAQNKAMAESYLKERYTADRVKKKLRR